MIQLRIFASRIAGLIRNGRRERELEEELDFHVQMEISENLRRGMCPDDARNAALRSFGGVARAKETYRETGGLPALETVWQDTRFGLRMLRRSPGFSILAVICLTVGIGATTSVFSWIEGISLRPFPPVAHQERLMAIAGTKRDTPGHDAISSPDFLDFQRNCASFDAFIGDKITGVTLSIGDHAERAPGSIVSANYFDALGIRPILGRGFEPAEGFGRNGHPVTVINYRVWKERFRGDPNVIGKTQMLNGMPHTIVGVAPKGFQGTFVGWAMQFWVPMSMQELFDPGGYKLDDRGARWIEGFVRLKPGVTAAQAQAEISAVARRLESEYPATNAGRGARLYPLWETPFNGASTLLPTLQIALFVVVFVLLIACANVSNLLLGRAFVRRHEISVRLAIGCGRGRLLRQLLTEGLILSGMGAAGGLILAGWSRNLLMVLIPARAGMTPFLPGELDWRVLAMSAGVCLVSTVVFGLAPAVQTTKIDLASSLKAESGGVVGGHGASFIRPGLVVLQVALSFILLTGAGLLFQSLRAVRNTNPGFSMARTLNTWIDFTAAGYTTQRLKTFEDELIDRLRGLGGVESAAFARMIPFSNRTYSTAAIAVDGYAPGRDEQPSADYDEVGPDYFTAMGIPLVAGREFTRADNENAPPVAVVNEAMAAKYWRGRAPIGTRLQVKGRWVQVAGVARTSKYRNLTEAPRPFFYVPMRQSSMGMNLVIRSSSGAEAMAKQLARELRALDSNLSPGEVITMKEQVERTTAPQRITVMMLTVFGGIALLLATIGLYGVISDQVSQRVREVGLRMALGAGAQDVLQMVMLKGLALTAGGVVLGAAVALGSTRLIVNMLYKVDAHDPLAFGAAFAVMTIGGVTACFVPAWRATRTDPVRALRG